MSLAVAVPCGIAAAIAYGASTAAQHAEVHTGAGEIDAQGLVAMLHNPRWLLAMAGDGVGLLLQVIALSTGPVVLIQPLLILAVPVAMFAGSLLGGPRPTLGDYLASFGIIAGVGTFFLLVGDPGEGDPLEAPALFITIGVALAAGAVTCFAVRGRRPAVRAIGFGCVAGAYFGMVGVMLNAVAETFTSDGLAGFGHAKGIGALLGVALLGGLAILLTQISFQVGALSASFPANESTAPVVAVLLGAVLLNEHVPVSAWYVLGYAAAFAVVVAGTIRLAREQPPVSSTAGQNDGQ
jgi:drug/metabolite transporter (DMT)-like permease